MSAGLGLEDDSQVTKVYLPKDPTLVLKQAVSATSALDDRKLQLVAKIMKGVHLAAVAEAMSLGVKVGLNLNQLFEIISKAAGASSMFLDRGPQLLSGKWTSNITVDNVIADLVNLCMTSFKLSANSCQTESMEEANRLKFPLHLTGTALQLFQLASLQGLGSEPDIAVAKLWNGKETIWQGGN